MKYTEKSFSVPMSGDDEYRKRFDAIDWTSTSKKKPATWTCHVCETVLPMDEGCGRIPIIPESDE